MKSGSIQLARLCRLEKTQKFENLLLVAIFDEHIPNILSLISPL